MQVLLLTQVLPYPPDSGPKIKTWNVIKYLAQRHDVTLVSFVRGDQSKDVEHLRRYCRAIYTLPIERGRVKDGVAMIRSLATGQPWMMVRDARRAMRSLVQRLSQEEAFDVVHADQLNMAQYAWHVPGARKVLDAHNALWLLYQRTAATMPVGLRKLFLERDWRLLKRYEGRVVREFDAVLAVSEEDKAALLDAAGVTREVTVIPIAIDMDEVQPVERVPEPTHILHIGTMYWPPNIDAVLWFAREVYPLIRQQRADVQFDIVGARPPAEILALGESGTGINVTGYVEDPTPYFQQAAAMIVPLRAGGGMRVKILNAMAQGIPIVSTTLGYEGIELAPGGDLLVGDAPDAFASQILTILGNPKRARDLAVRGRRLIAEKYDYRSACKPLDRIYREMGTSG